MLHLICGFLKSQHVNWAWPASNTSSGHDKTHLGESKSTDYCLPWWSRLGESIGEINTVKQWLICGDLYPVKQCWLMLLTRRTAGGQNNLLWNYQLLPKDYLIFSSSRYAGSMYCFINFESTRRITWMLLCDKIAIVCLLEL